MVELNGHLPDLLQLVGENQLQDVLLREEVQLVQDGLNEFYIGDQEVYKLYLTDLRPHVYYILVFDLPYDPFFLPM